MDLTLAALKRHLDVIDRNTPGGWQVVSGDVRNHDVPDDPQHLNTNASWVVGPKSRSRYGATKTLEALDAIFDLIRSAYPGD